jgi:hypothetical protein
VQSCRTTCNLHYKPSKKETITNSMPNNKKNNKKMRRNVGRLPPSREPPKVRLSQMVMKQTFRFSAGSGLTGAAINSVDFMGLLSVATASTTLTSIISAVRIRRITIYSPASSTTNANSEIIWAGNEQREQIRYNTAAVSGAFPATTSSVPPANSDVSKWFDGSVAAFTVCKLTVPSASIIDIKLDYSLQNAIQFYTPNTYTGSSGLTTGYVYFGPLDRVSSGAGSTKLNPLGSVSFYA